MSDHPQKVIRATPWLDGDEFPDLEWLMARILSSDGHCVICGAEQPHDLRWPAYSIELEAKDGSGTQELEYRACPADEQVLDRLLKRLGA